MTNVGENNTVATEAAPVLCQVVFHQDELALSPSVSTEDADGTAPPAGAIVASTDQAPTKTTTPKADIPTAIGGIKSSPNLTQSTDGLGAESELAANCGSDVTSAASYDAIDIDSDYSGLSENLPAISENRTELVVQTNKINYMHTDIRAYLEEYSHRA